jgi:hypothetical protein
MRRKRGEQEAERNEERKRYDEKDGRTRAKGKISEKRKRKS